MKIIYCHSCDEIFAETEMTVPDHCPVCGANGTSVVLTRQIAEGLSDRLIEGLWLYFGNCEYDSDTETILEDFMDFPTGTWREDIWHWFDEVYSKGVVELMYM